MNLRLAGRVMDPGQRWECVLWGGYGVGNTGDDLTLAVALKDAQSRGHDKVSVMTPHAEAVQGFVPSAQIVPYVKPSGLFRRLGDLALAGQLPQLGMACYRQACGRRTSPDPGTSWIDVLHSARNLHLVGGGYLTDRFDLNYYLPPLRLAAALGIRITTSPLGLGPFVRRSSAAKVAAALRTAMVKVRDADSLSFCRQRGLNAEGQADDGFRLREVIDVPQQRVGKPGNTRKLGVCAFHQYEERLSSQLDRWWEDCLRSIKVALPGWQIGGFCFHRHRGSDFETTRRLFRRAGLDPEAVWPPEPDFRKAVIRLQEFDAVLSTRFHAVVSAAVLGIPCVAVAANPYYEIKMRSAASQTKLPIPVVTPGQAEPETVASSLMGVLNSGERLEHSA